MLKIPYSLPVLNPKKLEQQIFLDFSQNSFSPLSPSIQAVSFSGQKLPL